MATKPQKTTFKRIHTIRAGTLVLGKSPREIPRKFHFFVPPSSSVKFPPRSGCGHLRETPLLRQRSPGNISLPWLRSLMRCPPLVVAIPRKMPLPTVVAVPCEMPPPCGRGPHEILPPFCGYGPQKNLPPGGCGPHVISPPCGYGFSLQILSRGCRPTGNVSPFNCGPQ